jgi:peptide/nickel transport system substrate-binding protein
MRFASSCLTLSGLCLTLAACGGEPAPRADTATSVVIGIAGDPVTLDPANAISAFDGAIIDLTYQQLTAIDATSTPAAIKGELAEGWTVSSDGLSWTFALKQNQRFDDGSPVTAEAVKASIDRVRAVGRSAEQGLFWLKSVEVVDQHTVRFDLTTPFAAVPAYLALPAFSVVNPAAIQANQQGDNAIAWFGENTAGSGIYRVASWRRGEALELQANPASPDQPKSFSSVRFSIIPNEGTRRLQLEKGDIDFTGGLGATASESYRALPGVTVEKAPFTMDLRFITINTERAALKDVRVRQAIAKAIDYEALRSKILSGNVGAIAGYLPEGVPGAAQGLDLPARDIDGAKALLAEAGFDPATELKLMVTAYGPVAEFIQSQLKDAGINVVLQRLAPSAVDAVRSNGEFDLFYDGWVLDVPDPAIFFNLAFASRFVGSGVNASRFSDPSIDQALDAALANGDPEARAAAYSDIERRLMAARPVVMLFATLPIAAYRKDIAGVRLNPYQTTYLNIQDWTRAP